MRVHFLGVRGSTPEPDPACARYGGHTSCIAISADADSPPVLLLDAGTGIRLLEPLMAGEAFRGTIAITHLHWDHMHGLPFARPLDRADALVDLLLPVMPGRTATESLAHAMSPPLFPIGPDGLQGAWTFNDVPGSGETATPHKVGAFTIRTSDVMHKGGRTVAVRVDGPDGSLAYLPDHQPEAGVSDQTWALLEGVDLLLHDGQFLDTQADLAHAYGHATISEAVAVARRCKAKLLVLTHHSPGRTDAALDSLAAELAALHGHASDRAGLTVSLSQQGTSIDLRPI